MFIIFALKDMVMTWRKWKLKLKVFIRIDRRKDGKQNGMEEKRENQYLFI